MKIIFILFITFTFSFSSNLLYLEEDKNKEVKTYCIDDDYYYDRNIFYFYNLKSNSKESIDTASYQKIVIIGGWELDDDNNCIFDKSRYYGLTYEQYHYLMALFAILIASIGIIFVIKRL